ncbi:MAG TPA: hypothetical protein VK540_34465 [Polyangiaceae bacterium]|jgi:hypothetical protein|nr:hypothetical protein [Polyangiaceae bacterium]
MPRLCNAGCTPAKINCPDGETYHADDAKVCNDEYRALTCSALRDPVNKLPAVCDQRCTK